MSKATPKQYLEMWLSEQIPVKEWQHIIAENIEVRERYIKHLHNEKRQQKRNKLRLEWERENGKRNK